MSRSYPGIGLNAIPDRATRSALQMIDTYLRDVSADLSMGEGASGMITTALGEPYLVVGALSATLTAERQLVVQTPLSASDGGANGAYTLSVGFTTPALTLGTANALGANNQPIRSDATILVFDVTVPATLENTAAVGTAVVAARRDHVHKGFNTVTPSALAASASVGTETYAAASDHVHIFPTTLQSTGTVATLAMTAAATVATITASLVTLDFTGMTAFRPGANNTITFGGSARRWLQGYFGTSGISNTGGYTQASGTAANTFTGIVNATDLDVAGTFTSPSGVGSDWIPSTGGGVFNLGGFASEWGDLYLYDDVDAFGMKFTCNSTAAMTANRTVTIDCDNADRTLRLGWLTQDVSSAGSPAFVTPTVTSLNLDDSASAFNVTLQATGTGMTANRALTLDIGNVARTLTLSGNPTLGNWFDQAVKTTAAPQFGYLGIGAAADATALLTVNDSVVAPATNSASVTNRYGGDTNFCGDPSIWLRVRISGTNYKIPCYA